MRNFVLISWIAVLLVFLMPVAAVWMEPEPEIPEQQNEITDADSTKADSVSVTTASASVAAAIQNPTPSLSPPPSLSPSPSPSALNSTDTQVSGNKQTALRDADITVRVLTDDGVVTMPLDRYLLGVLAAEMPASFPVEALKAQAVAARTFTLSRIMAAKNGKPSHENADVCTNPSHCKAFIPWEEITVKWEKLGLKAYEKKMADAVSGTDGEILVYNGEPIVAVFHAASGAYTENAKDVWGSDVPYLRSVASPDGAEYVKKETVGTDEFKERFLKKYPAAVFGKNPSDWISDQVTSKAGGVICIHIGGVKVSGTSVRALYSLASANFKIEIGKNKVIFTSAGFGHCVGMSQYGARALALEGKDYKEILQWYYTNVKIEELPQKV